MAEVRGPAFADGINLPGDNLKLQFKILHGM
jgi:hypothetical protein